MFPAKMISIRFFLFPVLFATFMAACQQGTGVSSEIRKAMSEQSEVDLAAVVRGQWQRVCVLGPYSKNAIAEKTLGFRWDVESRSSIKSSDGISLLIFGQDRSVIAYAEYERRFGDFSTFSGRCFPRIEAKFAQKEKGRPKLVLSTSPRSSPNESM